MAKNPYGPGRFKKWDKDGDKIPPDTPGEYRIQDKETGEILYIGESGELQDRLNAHTKRKRKSK